MCHETPLGSAALTIHAHLALAHRLEKRRLCPGGSAVDFVREQDIGEDRPLVKMELLIELIEDRNSDNI